jgi:hypothetical protein
MNTKHTRLHNITVPDRSCRNCQLHAESGHINSFGSGGAFDPSDCNSLCTKAQALESCINDECDKGTQPAGGSWKTMCDSQQADLNNLYGTLPQDPTITLCAGSCSMECEKIGDW